MKRTIHIVWLAVIVLGLTVIPAEISGQSTIHVIQGKEFDRSVPQHFYLEGQAIPIQKRNSTLVKGNGMRSLLGLLDTSGYGTDITQKYNGMIFLEGKLFIGGQEMSTGAYGFGVKRPAPPARGPATIMVYDIAGVKVAELSAALDERIQRPRPLQVIVEGGKARLYLGRDWLELK